MLPRLRSKQTAKLFKAILPKKSLNQISSTLPVLTNFTNSSSSNQSTKSRLFVLGAGLAALVDKEENTEKKPEHFFAPPPITTDPTAAKAVPSQDSATNQQKKKTEKSQDDFRDRKEIKPETCPPYEDFDREVKTIIEEIPVVAGTRFQFAKGFQGASQDKFLHMQIEMNATPAVQRVYHACALHVSGIFGHDFALRGSLSGNMRLVGVIEIKRFPDWLLPFQIPMVRFSIVPTNPQYNSLSAEFKYPAKDWCFSGVVENKGVSINYLQNIWNHPKIRAGLQFTSEFPLGRSQSLLIPLLTYAQSPIFGSVQVIPNQMATIFNVHRHFYKSSRNTKNNRYCSIGTQFGFVGQTRESTFSVGAKMERTKWSYNAKISSDGTVSVAYSKEIRRGLSMTISGELYHFQNQPPMFGIGFQYSDTSE